MVVGALDISTDVLVIGSGPGGYVAAIRAAQLGFEVLVVEKEKRIGGVCLHTGCIPTKALIHASDYSEVINCYKTMGITFKDVNVDLNKINSWKNGVIDELERGIKSLFKNYGIEVIEGTAVFKSNNEVHIEGKTDISNIKFKHCIIATGSSPINVPGFNFDGKYVISSTEALNLDSTGVPQHLIIIGGGYIGTELGTVYSKLGSKITIVEFTDRLIPSINSEIVSLVSNKLDKFGVTKLFNSKALGCEIRNDKVYVKISREGKEETIEGSKVLVVVGRSPNTKGIGLENTSVKLDSKGFIIVDKQQRTSVNNIFAIGDVVGQPMLAHKATREGKIAAEVIAGMPSAFDNKVIPFVVFNDPELASVGMTEPDAKAKGIDYIAVKFPFSALGRSKTLNEGEGFLKYVAEKNTRQILGVHIVGPHASDIIGEATLAIEMGATLDDIALTIHAHPSYPESLMEGAEMLLKKGIHIYNPEFKKK
ncbi:MAG TPA: dihydrolipoyl dehydrogenase [Alphaproteobacteria bacterium]|nr:dihydrolipoyl dehydrogenase [Alphaproteobacteria bacterium]